MYLVAEEDPQAVDQADHQVGAHQEEEGEEARQEAEESSHYPDLVQEEEEEEEANLGEIPLEFLMAPAVKRTPL